MLIIFVFLEIKIQFVNQHPPVHHEGWMISGQETVFCWVPVPYLTLVVSLVAFIFYLTTNNPQTGCK